MSEDVTENPEDVAQVGASWRLLDQSRVQIPQQRWQHQIQDGRDQVRGPVADEFGKISRGDAEDSANVDKEIKPQHDTVDGLLRVDDDPLAVLVGDNVGLLVRALVDQGWGNVGLELRCADGEEVQGEGKGAKGIAGLQDGRQGRNDHDDVGDTADGDTLADHPETTVFGIGEPAEEDGEPICQKLERLRHGRGHRGAPTERTGSVVTARICGAGTGSVHPDRKRGSDEVLVHLVAAVVRGSLGELDGAKPVGRGRHLAGDAAERRLLFLSGKN